MKVFLCHSSSEQPIVDLIHAALTPSFGVFYSTQSLPEGEHFDQRIRAAIESSDLFVFCVSKRSIEDGRYTATELKFAQRKWPNPAGRVLPVVLDDTLPESIPAYLRVLTTLKPKGNVAAEVLDACVRMRRAIRRRALLRVGILAILSAGITVPFLGSRGETSSSAASPNVRVEILESSLTTMLELLSGKLSTRISTRASVRVTNLGTSHGDYLVAISALDLDKQQTMDMLGFPKPTLFNFGAVTGATSDPVLPLMHGDFLLQQVAPQATVSFFATLNLPYSAGNWLIQATVTTVFGEELYRCSHPVPK